MTRARSLAVLGVALIGLGLAAWLTPPAYAQTSAPPLATGWWTSQPFAQPVPEDGFEVAWAFEQELSMAAVRFDTSLAGGGTIFIVLKEIGGNATDQGFVDVCPTKANTWTSANPGSYADRPETACTQASTVRLGRDLTTKEWAGDITALANPTGTVSLAVRPVGKNLSGSNPPTAPFSVRFGSAEIRYDPPTTPTSVTTSTSPPDTSTFELPPSFSSGGSSDFGSGSGFDTPDLDPVDPPTTETTVIVEPGSQLDRGPVNAAGRGPRPWGRVVVLTPISAGIGTLGAAGRRWRLDRN